MVYNGKDKYDNSDEKNNLWDKLENLINQIDELKDDNKDNDELIWIFEQWSRALDDWLYNELSNCNINILNEIEDKILWIYSESDDLWININAKSSLESLLQIITNIRNTKSPEDSDQEEKLEKEYKEIWSIWSMNPDDYNKMQKSLGGKAFIKKLEKKWDRYSYSPEKLKSYLNDIKWNDWGGFLKMLDKGKNWNTEEERNENIWKWRAVISAIQILLNEKFPNNPIIVDWKYGTKTKQRVKDFQDSYKLKPDSKPWKNTIDALLWNKIEETSEKDDRADYIIKDLTQEQIDNIEKIRNIWFTIYEEDFDLVKDLTQEQIDNIETMWKIWIKIYVEDFDLVKDLTQEQIDNIKKIRNIWFDINIDNIYDLTEFNEADFEILWINSEFLYESYDYTESEIEAHQNYKKWKIIENIEDFIQNVISENRDIGKSEIIEHIRSDLVTLPVKERISIIIWINKSVHKFNTVRKYLDFDNPENEYKTPKELLCAIRWIKDPNIISEITDDITVTQHWAWMIFFVWDEDSYEKGWLIKVESETAKEDSGDLLDYEDYKEEVE